MTYILITFFIGFIGGAMVGCCLIEDNLIKLCVKLNNQMHDVRTACKKLKVSLRGKDGKIVGAVNVWQVISEDIKNV